MRRLLLSILALVLLSPVLGAQQRAGGVEPDPQAVQQRLLGTLQDLAALGYKKAGTAEGWAAGDYVAQRFQAAGLSNVRYEPFNFLRFVLQSSSLDVITANGPVFMAHDVFAYSGSGQVNAVIEYVGNGRPEDYLGRDVTGKVVMVDRDVTYHRSSQYTQVIAHGGAAMLYLSQSPSNLIQIGTVTDPEDGLGPIPAVTVGRVDGDAIIDALQRGTPPRAIIDVSASVVPAVGRNVVADYPGNDPSGSYLLVGAHYDTWQIGSMDNGTGVAVLLELAEAVARDAPRRYGVRFVGYDAEELGLFGGYDYLRDHVVVAREPMLGFVNLEIPGSGPSDLRALARTTAGPVDEVLDTVGIPNIYDVVVDMKLVPQMFGGIIPTDIQGMYWYGLQGFSTACDTPYYHTTEDTPDKIDLAFLAEAAMRFESTLKLFHQEGMGAFKAHEDAVWRLSATRRAVPGGVRVEVGVTDVSGQPQSGAEVRFWLDVDDFTRVFDQKTTSDSAGTASMVIPQSALGLGQGSKWIHITAGVDYPLAETILRVPGPLLP